MAACPGNPPPHPGYVYWTGGVPPALSVWAVKLLDGSSRWPFGQEWTMPLGSETVIARKDHHTWTYRGGKLVHGCFTGITLYRPRKLGEGDGTAIDPNDPSSGVAQFTDAGTDWAMVGLTGGFILGASLLFAWAIKHAGNR